MNASVFRQLLESSFEDARLARSEKSQLKEWLEANQPDAARIAQYRNMAFDLAKQGMTTENGPTVVGWLEDIVKLLHPVEQQSNSLTAYAMFSPQDRCPGEISALLAQARRTVDICVYTITDDRVTASILEAHQRGVRVRVITDNDKAFDEGSDAERLRASGILLRVDRTPYHMHHKFAIFDDSLLLNGSYNWTRGAAENNEENFVVTDLPQLVTTFVRQFNSLWDSLAAVQK